MVDKQQNTVPLNDTTKISVEIVNELDKKHVDWECITDSLLRTLNEGKSLSAHQYAIISSLEIARLGAQLSNTNSRLDKIEKLLKYKATKSP